MQLSFNQPKSATMNNNPNSFTNFYHMQGKVMNNFGHHQNAVRFEFFEDAKTSSLKETNDGFTESNTPSSEHTSNDDILTQDSKSENSDVSVGKTNEHSPSDNSTHSPKKIHQMETNLVAYTPAKKLNPNVMLATTLKPTVTPGENPNHKLLFNHLNNTNHTTVAQDSNRLLLAPATVTPTVPRVNIPPTTNVSNIQPNPVTAHEIIQTITKKPINNPNVVLDENGQICNGFITARALDKAINNLHNKAKNHNPNKSHTSLQELPDKNGHHMEETNPINHDVPQNNNVAPPKEVPKNPYTTRAQSLNVPTDQNKFNTFADKTLIDERVNTNPHNTSTVNEDNTHLTSLQNNEHRESFPQYKNRYSNKLYYSPLLDPSQRPSEATIILSPELEPLRQLIMSQHEAFSVNIKELGEITISSTSAIDSKVNSYKQLKFHNKIPRSLRIKCKLTTSPDFSNDEIFLSLKEELDNIVSTFTSNGTKVMTNWAERNIKLLQLQRCTHLFHKILPILECLTAFHLEVIGKPNWPSTVNNNKNISAFLLTAYFNNLYIDTSDIVQFLDLTREEILIIGYKYLLKLESQDEIDGFTQSLNLSDINSSNELHLQFVWETLIQFDQILRCTTIDLWQQYEEKSKQSIAAFNITAKMAAIRTENATTSTAIAISKATETFNDAQTVSCETQLRLNNLEKNFHRQEQKTNELNNKINKTQKNANGSRKREAATSPFQKAPTYLQNYQNSQLVDLTTDQEEETAISKCSSLQNHKNQTKKRHKLNEPTNNNKGTIQWRAAEVCPYNPNKPSITLRLPQSQSQAKTTQNPFTPGLYFASALPPTPLTIPSSTPLITNATTVQLGPFPQILNPQTSGTNRNPFRLFPQETTNTSLNKPTLTARSRAHHGGHNKQKQKG